MEASERGSVQDLDSGSDAGHNRRTGLLAIVSRSNKRSDSLPSCATATPQSLEPLGRRDDARPGPAHLTVSTRTAMPHISTAPNNRALDAGIYVREINGHNVFLGIRADGTPLPGICIPLGDETDDDVIVALADVVFPSCRLQLVAGTAPVAETPAWTPPRVALRLEPSPRRSPPR